MYIDEGTKVVNISNISGSNYVIAAAKVDASKELEYLPLRVIIHSFMISELKRGFEIGFLIF